MSEQDERRRFDPDVPGGVETAYHDLPFKSTSCEDWYGLGDQRCPNRYKETGNLETDIASLTKWISIYPEGSWWKAFNRDLLEEKRGKLARPDRSTVFDPSTQSSFTPFGDLSLAQLVMDYFPLQEASAEPEEILYPLSANVRISFTDSNIGMFSTSIPIADAGQLQALSNASDKWKYTLIGSGSTNQPLMSLSGLINKINSMIASVVTPQPPVTQPPVTQPPVTQPQPQPPVITTDHIPPPEMPVEEPPMVTPTEPDQVNWIPEPFFSFINNVFRK